MHAGTMQALVVVLPEYLPIAADGLLQHVTHHQIAERPCVRRPEADRSSPRRRRITAERDEQESAPFVHPYPVERVIPELEPSGASWTRSGAIRPAGRTPRHGRTNDGPDASLLALAHRASRGAGRCCGTWTRPESSAAAAASARQLERAEGARSPDFARATHVDPVAVPDPLEFPL